MSTPLAGDPVLASDGFFPRFIQKAAAEIVNNSSVLQDDNDFVFALPVGTFRIELFCHISAASATPDFGGGWTFSGTTGSTGRSIICPGVTSTVAVDTLMRTAGHAIGTVIQAGIGTATSTLYHEDMITTVTVAGTMKFQWAQFAANASDTTMSTASRCYISELQAF